MLVDYLKQSLGKAAGLSCHKQSPPKKWSPWTVHGRIIGLSQKFWSSEKIGPGDQNSRNNGTPGPFSPEKFGPDLE